MSAPRGAYIAFEGIDGCGKSTQARLLAAALDAQLTFEPGATPLGARLREALLHDDQRIAAHAEMLLFAADRAQHLDEIVRPALEAGRHVVSDRSVWSSAVYQGIGRRLGVQTVLAVNDHAVGDTYPDVVVLLRATPESAVARRGGADRIETQDAAFFDAVAAGFDDLAADRNWVIIEPGDIDSVAQAVLRAVQARLDARNLPAGPPATS